MAEAVRWYERAAHKDQLNAQSKLGTLLADGQVGHLCAHASKREHAHYSFHCVHAPGISIPMCDSS